MTPKKPWVFFVIILSYWWLWNGSKPVGSSNLCNESPSELVRGKCCELRAMGSPHSWLFPCFVGFPLIFQLQCPCAHCLLSSSTALTWLFWQELRITVRILTQSCAKFGPFFPGAAAAAAPCSEGLLTPFFLSPHMCRVTSRRQIFGNGNVNSIHVAKR